jgi:hypothetical protein
MHGLVFVFLGLGLCSELLEREPDVVEIQTRAFALPLRFEPDRVRSIDRVHVFVSRDQGKVWKHLKDFGTSAKQVAFAAPGDGLYWFAVQVVTKDGEREPPDLQGLIPAQKVYVNTEGRALELKRPCEELRREVEALREEVERLKRRVRELEAGARSSSR